MQFTLSFVCQIVSPGVSADKENKMNPLYSILDKYNEDDLIIVKLDIDTPNIENPMAYQLLEDETIHKLVDHFYFEHHVDMEEMTRVWTKRHVRGSTKDTFDLMNGLRQRGVASHFWI